jgi:Zn-finger protein
MTDYIVKDKFCKVNQVAFTGRRDLLLIYMDNTIANETWREKKFSYFCHQECESYPCHKIQAGEDFNCLFCYCPLYILGEECGGGFMYLENGIKDCSKCTLPHKRDSFGYITGRFQEIAHMMKPGVA